MASTSRIIIIADTIRWFFLLFMLNICYQPFQTDAATPQTHQTTERILYMKPYVLASLIVFCALIAYENRKHTRQQKHREKSFWERECEANSTRRQSLENLNYIFIPFDILPMDIMADHEKVAEYHRILKDLSSCKIVNFTGISNTDLKLRYGAPNITLLTEYDQNYTLLARTLQSWAALLYENGYVTETQTILEFAVSTETDVSKSYYLLADIYRDQGHPEKIQALIETAETLHSALRSSIVRTLQGSGPYSG